MESSGEVVVFIDTSMGTHIAVSVSPDITAADFKRELERDHFSIFPTLGEIKAHALMVMRKSCFYHLTESLPIKYAFQGLKGTWFLHLEVQPSIYADKPGLSHHVAARNDNHFSDDGTVTSSVTNSKKINKHNQQKITYLPYISPAEELWKTASSFDEKRKNNTSMIQFLESRLGDIKECLNLHEETPNAADDESVVYQMSRDKVKPVVGSSIPAVQTPKERSQELVSVRRIVEINGNFSVLNSENKCCDLQNSEVTFINIEGEREKQVEGKRDDAITTSGKMPSLMPTDSPVSSGNKLGRTAAVGNRILIAANNLRVLENKQKPVISFYRLRYSPSMSSVSRISMFKISDNDD